MTTSGAASRATRSARAEVNGDFTLKKTGTWRRPAGTYLVCIWFAQKSTDSTTPIAQTVTFRKASGTISATVDPGSPQPDQRATVTVTGSSEATAYVYAKVRPAGGAACAPSYSADPGSSLIDGREVNGGFTTTATTTQSKAGNYVICLWLAASSTDAQPIAGPQTAGFTVVAPPPPCVVPALPRGASFDAVTAALATAHCSVGTTTKAPSKKAATDTFLRFDPAAGTELAPGAAVNVVLSAGARCRVPRVTRGLRLSQAKALLAAAHCTVGKVRRVSSSRKRGRVVRFSPASGTKLPPLATVGIRVSKG